MEISAKATILPFAILTALGACAMIILSVYGLSVSEHISIGLLVLYLIAGLLIFLQAIGAMTLPLLMDGINITRNITMRILMVLPLVLASAVIAALVTWDTQAFDTYITESLSGHVQYSRMGFTALITIALGIILMALVLSTGTGETALETREATLAEQQRLLGRTKAGTYGSRHSTWNAKA